MHSFAKTIILFLLLIQGFTSKAQSQNHGQKLKIAHLEGDYYIFTTCQTMNGTLVPANGMYVLTDKGAAMIDTPWDSTQFQPLLDSIWTKHRQKVVLCISTHSHDDRTAGLEFYKQQGIQTWTTKRTLELCKANNNPQAEHTFQNDTVFTLGNHSFETFYPGAGHTEDNIVLWFGDAKILYGGCFIKSTESKDLGYIAEANLPEWRRSVEKVIQKYPKRKLVIPGHFGWKSNKSLQHTLKLLKIETK